jgi:diguanylate cyclase (GGDEF)-like protein/PAS domain S-box-containing protein
MIAAHEARTEPATGAPACSPPAPRAAAPDAGHNEDPADSCTNSERPTCDTLVAVASAVVVLDPDKRIVDLNPAAAALLGVSIEETRGRLLIEVGFLGKMEADGTDASQAMLDCATDSFSTHLIAQRVSPHDGSPQWVRWTVAPIFDADGNITHMVATGTDVTAARLAHDKHVETARRFQVLLDSASDLVICVDAQGVVTHLSSAGVARLGYDAETWLGRSGFELIHPDDLGETLENFEATVNGSADDSPMILRVRHADGSYVAFETFAKNHLDDPDVASIVVSMRDITARLHHDMQLEESREALRLADRQFRSSFDHAPIGMALVALEGGFMRVNRALCELVGRTHQALLTETFQDITHPDDLAPDLELLGELLRGERLEYQMDKRYLRPDGSVVWAQLNVTLVRNQHGNPMHFVAQIQDIGERRALHADLLEQANHDSLTGLVNRACFEDRLADACSTAASLGPVTVVFIDLNEFKSINDTFGHAVGDLVLQQTAHRVRDALRPGDLAARLGGDELAALLVGADPATASQVAERLRAAIAQPMEAGGHQVSLTASVGHVSATEPVDALGLLSRADQAMYADKRSRPTAAP